MVCRSHFNLFSRRANTLTYEVRKTLEDSCPACTKVRKNERDRVQKECTIDPTQEYGQHIALTCRDHSDLRWHTKNIDYIGARSIFYSSIDKTECACSANLLEVVK